MAAHSIRAYQSAQHIPFRVFHYSRRSNDCQRLVLGRSPSLALLQRQLRHHPGLDPSSNPSEPHSKRPLHSKVREMTSIHVTKTDGSEHVVEAADGLSLMEVLRPLHLGILGECEGSLACASCHVWVNSHSDVLATATSDEEADMLDCAFNTRATSQTELPNQGHARNRRSSDRDPTRIATPREHLTRTAHADISDGTIFSKVVGRADGGNARPGRALADLKKLGGARPSSNSKFDPIPAATPI